MNWILNNGPFILAIALVGAWLLFLMTIIWPSLTIHLAKAVRKVFGLRNRPQLSVTDFLLWSRHITEAMLAITKTYDWRVSQWSGFATAVLTATLAFISAVVVEYLKDSIYTNVKIKLQVAVLGILASVLVYLTSHRRITLIKNEFLRIYTGLQRWDED